MESKENSERNEPDEQTLQEHHADTQAEDLEVGAEDDNLKKQQSDDKVPPAVTKTKATKNDSKLAKIFTYNRASFIFATRLAVSELLGALFILTFSWPQAIWIYMTCAIVNWQMDADTASVIKKTWDRTIGTISAATLGLAMGFLSLLIRQRRPGDGQAVFVGFALVVYSFCMPYAIDRLGLRGEYTAALANFTYGICLLAFLEPSYEGDPWVPGVYRMINILIGNTLSLIVAISVFPTSTKTSLKSKIHAHVKAAGDSAPLVFDNVVQHFKGERDPPPLVEVYANPGKHSDAGLILYSANLARWKDCKAVFPMLKYDPWFRSMPKKDQSHFQYIMAVRLYRSARIQMTIVLIDSFSRSDMKYHGTPESLDALEDMGRRLPTILDLSLDQSIRDAANKDLLSLDLPRIRSSLAKVASETKVAWEIDFENIERMVSQDTARLPLSTLDAHGEQSILFLQLVEQLILRVARFHFRCRDEGPVK